MELLAYLSPTAPVVALCVKIERKTATLSESDGSLLKHSHGGGLLTSQTNKRWSDKLQSPSTYINSSQSLSTNIEKQARVNQHASVSQESLLNTFYSTFNAAAVTLSWFTCTFHAVRLACERWRASPGALWELQSRAGARLTWIGSFEGR